MTGSVLFLFDLLVTASICVIYVQTARLIRWLFKRDASGGPGGGMPWRYSPFGPYGGRHPRDSGRRSPQRSAEAARPARRAVR
jgi:hypothetical protein